MSEPTALSGNFVSPMDKGYVRFHSSRRRVLLVRCEAHSDAFEDLLGPGVWERGVVP